MFLKHARQFILPDLLDLPVKLLLQFSLLYLVTKQDFAVISLGMLFFSYHPLGQLGTLDYLMLKLPEDYINKASLENNKSLSVSREIVLYTIFFSGLIVIAASVITKQSNFLVVTFMAFIIQSILYQKYLYRNVVLRYSYNLKYLFKIKVSLSLSRLILTTGGLYFFGVYGYLTSEAIIYLIPMIAFREFELKKFHNSLADIVSLVKLSLPFLLLSVLNLVSTQIDRWLIISNNSLEIFADYSLCIIVVSSILIIPGKVDSLIMQYFREFYVSEKSDKDYYKRVVAYLQFSIIILGLFATFSVELVGLIIEYYLPKYTNVLIYLPILTLILLVRHIHNSIAALVGLEFGQKYISLSKVIFVLIFFISTFFIKGNLEGILDIVLALTGLSIILLGSYLFRKNIKNYVWNIVTFIIVFTLVMLVSNYVSHVLSKTIIYSILIILTQYKYHDFFKFLNDKEYLIKN